MRVATMSAPLPLRVRRQLERDGAVDSEIIVHLGHARLTTETGLSAADATEALAWAVAVTG